MSGLGEPDVLLLDEPYQGFDRGSYLDFWQQVWRWRAEGRAVVVVTHLLGLARAAPYLLLIRLDQHDVRYGAVAAIMVLTVAVAALFGLVLSALLPRERGCR